MIVKCNDGTEKMATQKEIDVLQVLANDATRQEAAKFLKIGVRVVDGRLQRIRLKYRSESLYGALALFYRNGLIT